MKLLQIISTLVLLTSVASANPIGGGKVATGLLNPGQTVTYTVPCYANQDTTFALRGDGDGDIDCCVYDGSGNTVDCDTDSTDTCLLHVLPRWTGTFYFKATNNGRYGSYYTFVAQ